MGSRTQPRICVVTCMKNEGPFVLEWIAHSLAVGVTDFLIFTNDCDDGTDAILDHLDDRGIVRHLPNPTMALKNDQHHRTTLAYAPFHKEFRRSDYVMIIDTDEFFFSTVGDGSIPALLAALEQPDVISLSELNFGFGGVLAFEDALVTTQFKKAGSLAPGGRLRRGVKSIMKVQDRIRDYSNHRPAVHPETVEGLRWLDGSGNPVTREFMLEGDRGFDVRGRYDLARINHYTLRSGESMLAKFERGDAVRAARMNMNYFRKRNDHEAVIDDFAPRLGALQERLETLLRDKPLRRLHETAVAAHRAKIAALKEDPAFAEVWAAIREVVATT